MNKLKSVELHFFVTFFPLFCEFILRIEKPFVQNKLKEPVLSIYVLSLSQGLTIQQCCYILLCYELNIFQYMHQLCHTYKIIIG